MCRLTAFRFEVTFRNVHTADLNTTAVIVADSVLQSSDLSARTSGRIANLFCNHYHRSRSDRSAPVDFRLFSSHERLLYVRTKLFRTFCRLRKVAYHGRGGCLDYGADPARSKLVDRIDVLCPDARAGHMVTAALRLCQNRATRIRRTDDSSAHKPAHD